MQVYRRMDFGLCDAFLMEYIQHLKNVFSQRVYCSGRNKAIRMFTRLLQDPQIRFLHTATELTCKWRENNDSINAAEIEMLNQHMRITFRPVVAIMFRHKMGMIGYYRHKTRPIRVIEFPMAALRDTFKPEFSTWPLSA